MQIVMNIEGESKLNFWISPLCYETRPCQHEVGYTIDGKNIEKRMRAKDIVEFIIRNKLIVPYNAFKHFNYLYRRSKRFYDYLESLPKKLKESEVKIGNTTNVEFTGYEGRRDRKFLRISILELLNLKNINKKNNLKSVYKNFIMKYV